MTDLCRDSRICLYCIEKLQTDSMRQLGEFAKVINSSFVFNPYSLVFVVFVPPVPPPPATATGAAEMGK